MSHQKDGFIILGEGLMRSMARHACGLPRRRRPLFVSQAGQHMLEYAILLGVVTFAAVTMQFLGRRGLQTGVKMVSDLILEAPPPPKPPDPNEPVSTVQVRKCDDSQLTATGSDLTVQVVCSDMTEFGDAAFRRITVIDDTVRGASVNEDARLQVFQE